METKDDFFKTQQFEQFLQGLNAYDFYPANISYIGYWPQMLNRGFVDVLAMGDVKGYRLSESGRTFQRYGTYDKYIEAVNKEEQIKAEQRQERERFEANQRFYIEQQYVFAKRQDEYGRQQIKLARRQTFVNVCIAIATGIAAIYYSLEIIKIFQTWPTFKP